MNSNCEYSESNHKCNTEHQNNNEMYNNSTTSRLHIQKREQMRKQIRIDQLKKYFTTQRKILHLRQQQDSQSFSTYKQLQAVELKSIEQVRQQLTSKFVINYPALNKYLQTHYQQQLPEDIYTLLLELIVKPQFLKNQFGIRLLTTICNFKINNQSFINQQTIKKLVNEILKQHIVLIDQQRQTYKLDYFYHICWILFALASFCQNKLDTFQSLIKWKSTIQNQQSEEFRIQKIALLSELSTCPQLLPSENFIKSLMSNLLPSHAKDKRLMCLVVKLLDNYIRYIKQIPLRFESQQSNSQLSICYMMFISKRLQQIQFPTSLKIDLIKVLRTLVKSYSDPILINMFNVNQSQRLIEQLFYRSEFAEWQQKIASLNCFMEIICHNSLLSGINQLIGPQRISHLMFSSLLLPDIEVKLFVIACINYLLKRMPKIYEKQFKKYNFQGLIRQIQIEQANYNENIYGQYSLSDMIRSVYNEHIAEQMVNSELQI